MIVESILEGVLSKYLDKWFYGITKQNMKAEVLKGRFVISNIGLRQSIFMATNMPYDLRHSYVEKIQLIINWTSNQRVVKININKIYALLSIKQELDLDFIFMQLKKSSIKDYIAEFIKNQTSKLQGEKQKQKQKKDGGISGFLKKLLDNVHINIKSIHLRFENEEKKYSFGLRIQQILIINVDQKQNPQYFNRQKSTQNYINYGLTIDPLEIYLNPNQKNFLNRKSLAQITNQMIRMSQNRKVQGPSSLFFNGINNWDSKYSNILTISIKGILKRFINRQNTTLPQFQSCITFNSIQFNFTDLQFHVILSIISQISWYQGILQYYSSKVQIMPRKQRQSQQIISLIRKQKNSKKQKQVVKKMAYNYLLWVFKETHLQVKQKRFVQEALKNQITVENLFSNKKIVDIIRRVQITRIKQWINFTMHLDRKYQRKIRQFDKVYKKQYELTKKNKQRKRQDTDNQQQRIQQLQNEVVLRLSVIIKNLNIKISQNNNNFGIKAEMINSVFNLQKRKQNFKLVLSVSDLLTDVFKMGFGQKSPTYVSILKKNKQFQLNSKRQYLLHLQFQKSPLGKPLVFSSSKLDFQSIEITIFPQVLSSLYQIFIKQSSSQTSRQQQQQLRKKKTNIKSPQPVSTISGMGLQYNIIEGFIRSPYIVIPLSHTNDVKKDCWILRLGDLNIETLPYQSSIKSDNNKLFYQHYFIGLRSFQLKYFSSIQFFHVWLEYEKSMQLLKKLPGFHKNKYINVIQPISCSVDLSVMKKHVSPYVKKKMQSFIAEIKIQKVFIKLPKLLLDKLKHRVDVFGDEKRTQDLIQTHSKNIFQQNTIEGLVKISNEKFKCMTFYAVLKGYFIYFFLKDNRQNIIFTSDVRDYVIRLTSDHHSYINQNHNTKDKLKNLNIQLSNKQQHGLWKKHLTQLLSKRDRINDKSIGFSTSLRPFDSTNKFENKPSVMVENDQHSQIIKEQVQKIIQHEPTLLTLSFVMKSLQIQLIDEAQNQFLHCIFKKTKLNYSNVKEQKVLKFSILEWTIIQKQKQRNNFMNQNLKNNGNISQKKNIPFLSCKRLFKQKSSKKQNQDQDENLESNELNEDISNFLEVRVLYNHITGQLDSISIMVDQLYISWNIPIFNKILKFFFYKAEMADLPTAPSARKSTLKVDLKMKKFYLYCFHDEQLIALLKLDQIKIGYNQSSTQQSYKVECQKFQMDKYVDNNENKKVPMIICPKKQQSIRRKMKNNKNYEYEDNDNLFKMPIRTTKDNIMIQSQVNQDTNPMYLTYKVRKSKQQKAENVRKLRQKFGDDLLVSEIQCRWRNFIIYFDLQQTLRLLNYFINQILGTVASKFKKKQYSLNYISQTLKIKKITTFKVQFKDFFVMLTPHSRVDHYFKIRVDDVQFTKNTRNDKPEYEPKLIQTPTKRNKVSLFYETMVFDITNITPFYIFRNYKPQKLTAAPFHITITYSKLNFSRQYQPILNSLSDIQRTVTTRVRIKPGFRLQFQKIIFLTFLQIFYQNIKHRDGKANKFQTPHPQPALKVYQIDLGEVHLNMYEYLQQLENQEMVLQNQIRQKNPSIYSVEFVKNMKIFQQVHAQNISIIYKNQGQDSDITMKLSQIYATGQLPAEKKNFNYPCHLLLKMNSFQRQIKQQTMSQNSIKSLQQNKAQQTKLISQTFVKLVPQNLQISVNLDKLNHVIQFTNYDSDYTSNKIMPKKNKDSYMTVNVFPEKCCVKLGQLEVYGNFYITYTKDFKNPVDMEALKYMFNDEFIKKRGKVLDQSFIKAQVSDKQIKVNGQNLSIYINKKHVGGLKRLFFGRTQYASKQSLRRFRKQNAVIDGLSAMVNILQLKQLYRTYEQYIKKAKDYKDKTLILPYQDIPFKAKLAQKRKMQVQFEQSYVNIMRMLPQKHQRSVPPFMSYMTIQFSIPKILYQTELQLQLISIMDLSLKILQLGGNLSNNRIFNLMGLRLQYFENKQHHIKEMKIQNAKNIKVNLNNMNEKLFALFGKQLLNLKQLKKIQKSRNINRKIMSESVIPRAVSFNNIEYIQDKQTQQRQQTFHLIMQNLSSKNIQILISNFKFSYQQKDISKTTSFVINSKQIKIIEDSGIRLLQFLDQSAKQNNLITELGFRQAGHGPIIKKSMRQVLHMGQVQLFSTISLKYKAIPNGIKLQIFQPYSVINMTSKPICFCFLDSKKNKLSNNWVVVESGCQVTSKNINSLPDYFILGDHNNKIHLSQINVQNYPVIQISDLPTNFSPNKIGPLHLYPSYLMQVMKWDVEKNSKRIKLIIFNRFRLQNNLPLTIQTNYTIVQGFKESVIQGTFHTSSNNKSSPKKITFRIESLIQITYDLLQAFKQCKDLFSSSNSKPKKHQKNHKQYKVNLSSSNKSQNYYKILLGLKIGYANKSTEIQQHMQTNYASHENRTASYHKSLHNISSSIQSFIAYNQIVLVLNSSSMIKNSLIQPCNNSPITSLKQIKTSNTSMLNFGWFAGTQYQYFNMKRDTEYALVPEKINGLFLELVARNSNLKRRQYKLEDLNPKQSVNIWSRYVLTTYQSKLLKQKQTLYILEDYCTLENKTNHLIQVNYNINSKDISDSSKYKIIVYPKSKANIPLKTLSQEYDEQNNEIQLTAYCKSQQKTKSVHLGCTTRLEISKNSTGKTKNKEQSSRIDTLYWSINPKVTYPPKQFKRYQSNIIKVTSKCLNSGSNNSRRYQIILESSNQVNDSEIMEKKQFQKTLEKIKYANNKGLFNKNSKTSVDSGKIAKIGYKFTNNLPKNYAIIITQQKGVMPELFNIQKQHQNFYEDYDNQQNQQLQLDQLPSPKLSNKRLSKKISDMMSQAQSNLNQIPFEKKETIRFNKNLVYEKSTKQLNSSRVKTVEYLVEPYTSTMIGLTNLQSYGKKSKTLTLQVYRMDCNLQFEQKLQIKIDEPQNIQNSIIIRQNQNKLRNSNVNFNIEGIQINQIQSVNSQKSVKNSTQPQNKKKSINLTNQKNKNRQYTVLVHAHKKTQLSYQFFIQSKDLQLATSSKCIVPLPAPSDYERTTLLNIYQISLTIQVTKDQKDTLTLQLQNLALKLTQLPPSSHQQKIDLKISKLLIRQDKNLSILQMLHDASQFLTVNTSIQKTMSGSRFNNLGLSVAPIQLNIRQGILFKVLSRIVELRNHYFFYGQKLDQVLFIQDEQFMDSRNRQKIQSILQPYQFKNKRLKRPDCKSYKVFIQQRQKLIQKQIKKLTPKILQLHNFNLLKTNMYLSFSKDNYAQNKQQFIHDPFIKYFILIPAVSELRIDLPQIQIKQFKGTNKQFGKNLMKKMKPNIGGTIIRSLSSLSVLDSPVAALDGVFQYIQAILMLNKN